MCVCVCFLLADTPFSSRGLWSIVNVEVCASMGSLRIIVKATLYLSIKVHKVQVGYITQNDELNY